MTAEAVVLPKAGAPPAPVWRGYRFELVKLLAQWPVRLGLLACWLGWFGFRQQTPSYLFAGLAVLALNGFSYALLTRFGASLAEAQPR